METDQGKRKQLVWEIEKKLTEDDARPVIFYGRIGTCWQPRVKGYTVQVNSIYNGSRFEDLWPSIPLRPPQHRSIPPEIRDTL